MKTSLTLQTLLLALAFVIRHSSFVIAQGPLTPPGAPAPTMKTLDQVEPRTPIGSVPFTISTSGSYYLTRNLAVTTGDAIVITANDVTLDLNGFTLSSTASPASGTAVAMPAGSRNNVSISNGVLRGTTTFAAGTFTTGGFLHGVRAVSSGTNVRVADLTILGMAQNGISFQSGIRNYTVERCAVEICGTFGIIASAVRNCTVATSGSGAIVADFVRDSFGESVSATASNDGIDADTVVHSTGIGNAGAGINAVTATHCEATSATGAAGLSVTGAATFCRAKRDGGVAINAGIAIGCTVNGTGTVTTPAGGKFLGTP